MCNMAAAVAVREASCETAMPACLGSYVMDDQEKELRGQQWTLEAVTDPYSMNARHEY